MNSIILSVLLAVTPTTISEQNTFMPLIQSTDFAYTLQNKKNKQARTFGRKRKEI
mgnify:CR=1 FL=1